MGKQIVWAPPIPPLCPEQQRRLQMMYESVQSSAVFVDLDSKPPPILPKEVNLVAIFRPPRPPTPVVYTPRTIIDLSASTCATSSEAYIYSRLANSRGDSVFMILDPVTGIADDGFKASIIKHYRDENVAASSGIADEVLGASLLKRHCAEPGESIENVVAYLSSLPTIVFPTKQCISNIKLLILKKEEYDIWAMEMEHYLEYIDNDVWKVIQNGNSKKRISTGKDDLDIYCDFGTLKRWNKLERDSDIGIAIRIDEVLKKNRRRVPCGLKKEKHLSWKQGRYKMGLLNNWDDGIVNWGEVSNVEETNHATYGYTAQCMDLFGTFLWNNSVVPVYEFSKVYLKKCMRSTPITTNEKGVSDPKSKEVEPSCVSHIKTPRQPIKDQELIKLSGRHCIANDERELGKVTSFTKKENVLFVVAKSNYQRCDFIKENGHKRRDKKDIMLVQVYVDDIIFGSTKKSWCDEFEALMKSRFQMSSMGELTFFLGLQVKQNKAGIFISQDKYVAEILKKFDLVNVKTAITPMETKVALTKDEEAVDVDVHLYRSMIGSLMYLTASRPDIMYAVCVCSRFQVTPKTSHLNAVKRIFKYLKGKPHLGLWYPRESPFDLEAFSDSDYGGSNLDRKSTTGGCQFLGQRLISWQCKKQTIVATSTTEAEYVAAANCCGQVLWVQNQLLDYGFNFMNTKIHIDNESTICIVKNPVYHSKTKHIEIRHHFIRDCYEKKLISVEKIHTDLNVADLLTKPFDGPRFNFLVHVFLCFSLLLAGIAWSCRSSTTSLVPKPSNFSVQVTTFYYFFRFMAQLKYCDKHNQVGFLRKPDESAGFAEIVDFLRGSNLRYALSTNPTIYDSLVKQFWQTATANTIADGTLELHATIDTTEYTITEASIRDKLHLADASGITMLPNNEIFEGMGQMGYPTDGSFTFWKSFFTPQWRFLVHHLLHCISSKSGGWDQFGSNIATALICLSTGRVYNFSKLIFDGMVANLKSKTKFLMYPRFLQLILEIQTENKHPYLAVTLTKKIFGNMKRGFRGAPRPLLPAMLLVATTNPNAGQAHPDVAPSQPSSSTIPVPSTSLPPVQSPPPITTPIPASTPTPIPASTPTPIPETDPEPMEHTFEEPSPAHQHFSPPQEHAQEQMSVDDLLQLVPQLMTRVDSLEKDLKQTKLTMGSAIVKLVKKVKKLEGILKRKNVVFSDSKEEEPKDQGRKCQDDPLVSLVHGLVTPSKTTVNTSGEEQVEDISPNTLEAAKNLSRVASQKPMSIDKGRRYKRWKETKGKKVVTSLDFQEEVSTGTEGVNTAEGVNTGSIKVSTISGQVSTDSINKSIPSPDKGQRKGKAPMIIEEAPKKTKEQILQEEASLAEAIRLDTLEKEEEAKQVHLDSLLAQRIAEEEELNEQQKKRRAQVQFEAQNYTYEDWDLIRAKIEANAELSKSVLGSGLQGENFAKKMVELGTWKLSQLKNLSFEEVKEEFDKLVKQVESFVPINFEATKDSLKRFGEELQTKTSKRLNSTKIPINPVPVAMKSPSIATYKIIKQGERGVYQIVREDGTDIVYIKFGAMLKDITRDDLTKLYRFVMNRYGMNGPEDELEKVLWGYLKNMFEEPLRTYPILSLLGQQRIISWRYYDTCRVHCLNLESMDIYMLIERQYPLSTEVCKAMLDKKLQGGKPDEDCYKNCEMDR
ncbi:putative ribonuclease H-like domain-containing protein [Tanacetum coccineum]